MATNRLTGLISGMDTESLISQLVEARKSKVTKATKKQMSIKNKQDAWEGLNKKLKSFQSTISNMRLSSSYSKKTTNVSDSSVATITTADDAMLSTQNLKVRSLASAGYLTGGEIATSDGSKATAGTLLSDLGVTEGSKIDISVGGKHKKIEITEGMTLGSLANKLSESGVNAKFDAASQRMFISSTESGSKADFNISGDADALSALGLRTAPSKAAFDMLTDDEKKRFAVKNDGSDAKIELNGAVFTSSTNNFNVNGLSIDVKRTTDDDGVTLNTTRDTSAMYETIKKAISEYSSLINEMDKLYYANTKTKYDPLTDEEKSAMSDYEIEQWETKMKEQALAKDSTIGDITSKLTSIFDEGFTVNGKTMHLFDFGIEAAGYFDSGDNEKHALHIKGDKDDSKFATETNTLEFMISSDPDAVTSFFSQLSQKLYSTMNDMSSRVAGTRTFGNFFEDTKLKSDYDGYTTKIADLEEKLADYEDSWYKKFSKMETAMAKLQSKTNALSSYLGNS